MIWFAILMHGSWGVIILLAPESMHTTPIFALTRLFGTGIVLSLVLLTASGGTCLLLWYRFPGYAHLLLGLPQQFLLTVTALGGMYAVVQGAYADGTVRSAAFIFADQLPSLLAASMHLVALLSLLDVGHRRRSPRVPRLPWEP